MPLTILYTMGGSILHEAQQKLAFLVLWEFTKGELHFVSRKEDIVCDKKEQNTDMTLK